jgi:hypothetical protein
MSPDIKIQRAVVSRSRWPNKSNLQDIREHMRHIRATGRLVVHFSQGGVNTITFEAESTLNGHDHIELMFDKSDHPARG